MPISASAAGTLLPEHSFDVTTRSVLAYAAGIGMTDDPVFDDAGGELTAPPPFCVSLEWPVVSDRSLRQRWGATADELRRGVHACQDSIFHRPIRPGDRLTTDGQVIAVEATRAGARVVMRVDTRDAASRPVVTSYTTSIFRSVAVAGDRAVRAQAPPLPAGLPSDPERVTIPVARELPHVYTECARIWNPIHTERTVAQQAGLPDLILHGTATWALAGRELLRRYAGARPGALRRLHGRFAGMVFPGHPVELVHGALSEHAVAFEVRDHRGADVIRDGIALFGHTW